MKFFSYDSPFGRLFLKISHACCLNFLWLVCCLPVVTIGASTTALYYTSFKIVKDEGSFITTMFFRSFRQNFRQATVIWLIMLGIGALLGADVVLLVRLRDASSGPAAVLWTLLLAAVIACIIAYIIELLYIFPLLSIASNTTGKMFRNAFLIGTHYLFVTILVLFIHYAMFFLVVNVFTPLIIFGEGMCAVISAHLLLKIFRPLLFDPNAPGPDEADAESGIPMTDGNIRVFPGPEKTGAGSGIRMTDGSVRTFPAPEKTEEESGKPGGENGQ